MLDAQNMPSRVGLLDAIEEHKGDDEYLQVLYATQNSFTLSWPAIQRSITVDKQSLKTVEHDLNTNETAPVIEQRVCGFLGILPIFGLDHFVIAVQRNKVCDLPTYKQPGTNATTAGVYALQEVRLIPFYDEEQKGSDNRLIAQNEERKGGPAQVYDWDKIEDVVNKIKKYL